MNRFPSARALVTPLLWLLFMTVDANSSEVLDVRDFGAKGDGTTLDSAAINRAIAAAAAAGGGRVVLERGRYLSGTVQLRSHVTLEIAGSAVLLGSEDPDDYPLVEDPYLRRPVRGPLILARDAMEVAVVGSGTIDGQGAVWWKRLELHEPKYLQRRTTLLTPDEVAEGSKVAHGRPRLLRFIACDGVRVDGLRLRAAADWNVHPMLSRRVRIANLDISAPEGSHNTDGINPEGCEDVVIKGCRIDVGDDCLAIKSGKDADGRRVGIPCRNIIISDCIFRRGHGGIVIGSEMSGGVRDVIATGCIMEGTDAGLRIKTARGRGGTVENILVGDIVMRRVARPVTVTANYAGDRFAAVTGDGGPQPVDEGTPTVRDVFIHHVQARDAEIAGMVIGLAERPMDGIRFEQVDIRAVSGFRFESCTGIDFSGCRIQAAGGPSYVVGASAEVRVDGTLVPRTMAGAP